MKMNIFTICLSELTRTTMENDVKGRKLIRVCDWWMRTVRVLIVSCFLHVFEWYKSVGPLSELTFYLQFVAV